MELTLRNSIASAQHWLNKLISLLPACGITIFSYFITIGSMSTASFYRYFSGDPSPKNIGFLLFIPFVAALLFVTLPLLVNKFVLNQAMSAMGLQIPKNKWRTTGLTILALAYSVPVFVYLSQLHSFQSYYRIGAISPLFFIGVQLSIFPLYYFAEEVFFRGFVFLTLWERVGWHSFWISDLLFTFAHIGKPPLEIMVSIPASILFNYITLRSRSVLPSFCVHYTLGMMVFTIINIHNVTW